MHRTATPAPAPRATIGRHALKPAPVRPAVARPSRLRLMLALLSVCLIA